MSKNIPRIIPVALAATLLLGACGGDDQIGEPISTVAEQPASGSMRSPEPISVVSEGNGAAAASEVAADAPMVDDRMMMIAPYVYNYVAGDGLGALPAADTGYVFDVATTVTAEQVVALASTLGVTGDPVRIDEGYGVSWRVGPDDGSAPAVYVYDDAQLSWNYNGPWDDQVARGGCVSPAVEPIDPAVEGVDAPPAVDAAGSDSASSEPTESDIMVDEPMPIEPDFVCEEPAPPTGVLTAEEAQQRATDVLVAMGVDVSSLTWDNYADEWFASVNARGSIGSAADALNYGFGFGAEGVLQYASGLLATPEPVGPYTLIDLDTAIARLNDSTYGYGGGIVGPAIDMPAIAVGEPAPGDMLESGEPAAELETVTITLVDVQPDLWWVWDAEGSAWLLPAYRFIDTDGGSHIVPAVTDDYLIQVEPPVGDTPLPLPEPMPVDPPVQVDPPESTPAEPPTDAPPVSVVEVENIVRNVSYYPGCMTDPVEIEGALWYPIADWGNERFAELVKEIVAIPRAEAVDANGFMNPQVAAPGPGDDTGTLFVYADGIALYRSDSGNEVWMTTDEMTYDWVC